jgi:hypothetical protein
LRFRCRQGHGSHTNRKTKGDCDEDEFSMVLHAWLAPDEFD